MIALRPGVEASSRGRVQEFLDPDRLTRGDRKEVESYAGVRASGPEDRVFDHLVAKSNFVRAFRELLPVLRLADGQSVLELGAGHGWASCLVKRAFPGCHVVASDLSRDELSWVPQYEALTGVSLDGVWACTSRSLPFADAQFDRVFGFATLHHFGEGGDYSAALAEVARVLAPGGKAVFPYENHAPAWALALLRRRARRQRQEVVDEDVLHLPHLRQACDRLGCLCEVEFTPSARNREDPGGALYMGLLRATPALGRFVPCTVNLTLTKAAP